jgi:hypothetical protein
MIKSLSEIIAMSAAEVKHKDKIRVLVENDSAALRIILCCALHPLIKWELPEGKPDYKPNLLEFDQEGILYREMRRLYMFLYPNHVFHEYRQMRQFKRENAFIQLLEMVDREDAKLLIAAKDKTLPVKGLWWQIVEAAFPGIITQPQGNNVVLPPAPENEVVSASVENATDTVVSVLNETSTPPTKTVGHPNPNKGKPRSPETIAKMKAAHARRKAAALEAAAEQTFMDQG